MKYTYEQAVDYLLRIPKFAKKTTVHNLCSVLEKLQNPHLDKKTIHVAGTNGKGSTCAYIERILREAGYATGLFTSPHLVDIEERFRVNGEPVDRSLFLSCFQEWKQVMDCHVEEGNAHLSFFETLFVIATLLYRKIPVDYVIYETGLGGRLDATNVLQPEITVITSIGKDHMQWLGNTLEEIAYEKAGIMKQGVPVVFVEQKETFPVISKKAVESKAKQIPLCKEFIKIKKKDQKYIDFCFNNGYSRYDSLTLSTCAEYQVENAALAILTIQNLIPTMKSDVIIAGIEKMKWAGRMQEIIDGIFIDGAHNEPAIQRFVETVKSNQAESSLIFAVVQDKDYETMIELLTKDSIFSNVIITSIDGERQADEELIKNQFLSKGQANVCVVSKSTDAFLLGRTWQQEKENRILYCTGSLYLVGELYREWKKGVL